MNSKQWVMVIISGLLCLVVGVILIPVFCSILYTAMNIRIPVPVVILLEAVAMIIIVAVHSTMLLHKQERKPMDSLSTVQELKGQLDRLKDK